MKHHYIVCFMRVNMLFEVEFVTKKNGYFETIHTALIHALNVSFTSHYVQIKLGKRRASAVKSH
ncbi:hypothetical protein JV16_01602 [Anoxybacillus ayderensis]|uniref:Uncharacterized protein n=1 Tax=Anoxybacillus ayderensis TaxID=265546 RepID=A0A0D0HT83_9BACL|nr:hypothetical protein JV16_01602 [Anoxybacillus ayderensis]